MGYHMNMKKFGLSLIVAAIFGLVACGDDSSSANENSSEESSSSQIDVETSSSSTNKEAQSSSSEDPVVSSSSSDLGEQNSPHYFGFTGCDLSIDDDEWSFSVNYKFMMLLERTEFKYIVKGDTIVKTKSEIDINNKCKSKVSQLCDTEECKAEFEKTGKGTYYKPLNNVTDYIYCTDDGIAVLEQETIFVIGESAASKEAVLGDAKDECDFIQDEIDEDNQ